MKEGKDRRVRTFSGSTYSVVKKQVKMAISIDRPVFLWGPPGVGKSAMMKEIAQELDLGYIDLRMSLLNPIDLRGVPMVVGNEAKWMRPVFLPKDPGFLINFDELNIAPPSVQAASYQLILDGKCGEYELPENCPRVACGNRSEDAAVVHTMPAPLRNRMLHLELQPNLEDWKTWAYNNKVHSAVIGYLNWKPEDLFSFNPEIHLRNFPSPRSWESVSDLCNKLEKSSAFSSLQDYSDLLEGALGRATGLEFLAYSEVAAQLPDIDLIIGEGDMPEPPQDPGALYALCSGIVYKSISLFGDKDKKEQLSCIANILRYVAEKLPFEFATLCSKDLARTPIWKKNRSDIAGLDEASTWVERCGRVVLS